MKEDKTSAEVVDMKSWKYTKIAQEFVSLRKKDPNEAANFAKGKVKPEEFSILSKYIDAEIARQRGGEPYEEKEE